MTLSLIRDIIISDFAHLLDLGNYEYISPTKRRNGMHPRIRHKGYADEIFRCNEDGAMFVHHDPLTDQGIRHLRRAIERFRRILSTRDRKLFLTVGYDGWCTRTSGFEDVLRLYECLKSKTSNFNFVAVNCRLGVGVSEAKLLHEESDGGGKCKIYQLNCVGGNSGQRFDCVEDAGALSALLFVPDTGEGRIGTPYTFNLKKLYI
jgi:hypothetical protein